MYYYISFIAQAPKNLKASIQKEGNSLRNFKEFQLPLGIANFGHMFTKVLLWLPELWKKEWPLGLLRPFCRVYVTNFGCTVQYLMF